jgi:vacuolar-type H+-ATPase subunit E/Vma4
MLKGVLSKANAILRDAQRSLSVDSADAIERVCSSIENLNDSINKEIQQIEQQPRLSPQAQSNAKRGLFEKAGRRLEVLKDKSNYSTLIEGLKTGAPDPQSEEKPSPPQKEDDASVLKFMRERESRDRLFGMTEAQILSHFGESLFDGSNQLLLGAILNAPPGFEMLSESNLRKLRRSKAKRLATRLVGEPEVVQTVNASIMEIFSLAKKELDRLRKEELSKTFS